MMTRRSRRRNGDQQPRSDAVDTYAIHIRVPAGVYQSLVDHAFAFKTTLQSAALYYVERGLLSETGDLAKLLHDEAERIRSRLKGR